MISKYIKIYGRVQGVGFRWFCRSNARRLNVSGYVKNLDDGTVELVAQGDKVDELIELCKKGPFFSRVDSVKIKENDSEEHHDFTIKF
jgi:acylphosphatase